MHCKPAWMRATAQHRLPALGRPQTEVLLQRSMAHGWVAPRRMKAAQMAMHERISPMREQDLALVAMALALLFHRRMAAHSTLRRILHPRLGLRPGTIKPLHNRHAWLCGQARTRCTIAVRLLARRSDQGIHPQAQAILPLAGVACKSVVILAQAVLLKGQTAMQPSV